jgi:hypothetical protein
VLPLEGVGEELDESEGYAVAKCIERVAFADTVIEKRRFESLRWTTERS